MVPTREEWQQALEGRYGKDLTRRFASATVAVCGLGGLGSNIAIALARAGVGRLRLVDFDRVDLTNLHRQQYKAGQIGRFKTEALAENLGEIAPHLQIEPVTQRLTRENLGEILAGADIVCEAFDDPVGKAMLTDGVLETLPGVCLVAASGMAGMGSPNAIRTRKITDRFFLCGDGVSEAAGTIGLVAPRVMLCAAHQAHTVLRLLAGETDA